MPEPDETPAVAAYAGVAEVGAVVTDQPEPEPQPEEGDDDGMD